VDGAEHAFNGSKGGGVEHTIKVLQLEDNEADGELVSVALERAGLSLQITRVERRAEFLRALETDAFDLIISDFSLPDFDGLSALAALRQHDQEVPFIFVSGTIGEERAVEALRNGATDYVLKDRLSRLPAAIRRAIHDRDERRSKRRSEDRVRDQAALLDQAREAIVIQDLGRRVTYWNKGAEKMYGWTAEEAEAGVAEARVHAEAGTALEAAWQEVLDTGQWDGCLKQVTRDGNELIVESHWTCLRHSDGSPRAVISSSSDVTQARNLEAQLLRTQRLETVGTIASGVAHDLNNVLAPIIIGLTSLKRRVTDEPGQKLVNALEVSAERGAEIVKQVLTFARGTGALAGTVDTRDVIKGIEKLLAATLPRNVKLTMDLAPDLWPISGDPTQLQQVLLNLCVNARDAMPKGGQVGIDAANTEFSGDRAGRYVVLTVTDSGCGIDPSTLQKIFEPFFTTKTHGTGIGLSSVASIVKRHDGFIDVQSEVGRGTSFKVYLPAQERRARALPVAPQGDGKLLLVVDEASMREMMARTLEAYGYRVVSVGDATGALHEYACRQTEVSAVLVNFAMPDLDVVALVDSLTERGQPVRIINTSRTQAGQEGRLAPRAAASLPTPYTPEKLLEVVGRVVHAA
jgi:two-component system, cell cycle sensor histidine kinase and response regulator CckA